MGEGMNRTKRSPGKTPTTAVRTTTVTLVVLLMVTAVSAPAWSQQGSDPAAMQRVREELEVVSDLGRLFTFVLRMEKEVPILSLNGAQVNLLWQITEEIRRTERLTPARAEALTIQIEDEILSPDQLFYTDQQFLTRDEKRVPGTGSAAEPRGTGTADGAGAAGSSGGIIATYMAGGPYNPLLDESRQVGQDFAALRESLRARR